MSDGGGILAGIDERPGAVVLRLAGGEVLEIAPDAVPSRLPAVGQPLDGDLLDELRLAAARKLAARRLLALLDRRLDSRQRLRRKLCDQGLPPAAVDAVLDQAQAQGLHSDELFAAAYCRDALRTRAVGRRWLQMKLQEKGIAAELAAAAVAAELPPDRERALALQAAAERWRRARGTDGRALASVQRFLLSRGFATALAADAARAARPSD